MRKVYLAGPMRGIAQSNFPQFYSAAAALREQGYDVVSPAEREIPEVRDEALQAPGDGVITTVVAGVSIGEILSRDVKAIIDEVDGLVLLPFWFNSQGAKLEVYTGLVTGKTFQL